MHTFYAALILAFMTVCSAFFVRQMWRLGDEIDQARAQLEREPGQEPAHSDDMRLAA